jgi:hypothetical protein
MKIIAFGYKKRAGKDTSAKFLDSFLRVERPGLKVKKVSFASKLKDISWQLFGWAGLQPGIFYETEAGIKIKEVVLPKIGKSPRQIWIEVGNKMREVYQDVWIDQALQGVTADVLIITDLRFTNEANKIRALGGLISKIIREGLPQGTDPAEIDLDDWADWDFIVLNDGTLTNLHDKIEAIGRELLQ